MSKNKKKEKDTNMQPLGSQGSEASVNGETPAAEMEENSKEAKQKKPWSGKKKAIVIGLCAVLAVLVVAGVYALTIMLNPMGGFQSVAQQITPPVNDPKVQQTPTMDEPEPTVDPYDELLSKADFGLLDDIVNIMLIGVDYAEERETWKGKKDFHADVMIVSFHGCNNAVPYYLVRFIIKHSLKNAWAPKT